MTPVLLHGAGREARSAAGYFNTKGIEPLLYDDGGGAIEGTRSISLDEAKAAIEGALYLRSPGVPPTNALVALAAQKAALATTPTGYWLSNYAPEGTITVTGTKGKSTTTALLTQILCHAGLKSAAYGNIGSPLLGPEPVTETHPVVEISSYMMHDLPETHHLHLITSLFKEHTDWHGSEADYRAAKLRPFRQSKPAPGIAPRGVIDSEVLPPSVEAIEDLVQSGTKGLSIGGADIDIGPREQGFHQGPMRAALCLSLAAASKVAATADLKPAAEKTIQTWRGMPSRQEIIPTTDGRIWVDDALATIPEATLQALERFQDRDVRVILGGADRGQDLEHLFRAIGRKQTIKAFIFGPIAQAAPDFVCHVDSMETAITEAAESCPQGGIILFSPSAPSSDPHTNYKERSALLKRCALQLI